MKKRVTRNPLPREHSPLLSGLLLKLPKGKPEKGDRSETGVCDGHGFMPCFPWQDSPRLREKKGLDHKKKGLWGHWDGIMGVFSLAILSLSVRLIKAQVRHGVRSTNTIQLCLEIEPGNANWFELERRLRCKSQCFGLGKALTRWRLFSVIYSSEIFQFLFHTHDLYNNILYAFRWSVGKCSLNLFKFISSFIAHCIANLTCNNKYIYI